ncbi:DUF5677 domain-containing protein [Sutcliffiella sp. NC1]|uniref:DUF5677 domain-containing protein n=1 Tax=Sutcliffiella sp. NC1 TaxID=3004096 RepID=UPI0022DE105B|nr:DUF5677 domain-containing protein [Sutcliffiella sp. NC1]WBL16433.1 DUF5677 domain-containing protein [Sutcliffiella sp. NC1]
MRRLKKIQSEADKVFDNVVNGYFQKSGTVEFGYADASILGLLENLINHTKTLIVLIEKKHYDSLDIILRTVFENYVYLRYILETNTDLRAKSYVYSCKINEIRLHNSLIEDSLTGNKIRNFLNTPKHKVDNYIFEGMNQDYKNRVLSVYLNEIGMKRVEQKWYNIDGKTRNFKSLCNKLDLSVEYDIIYSILSAETHGKDAMAKFEFKDDHVSLIKNIKSIEFYSSISGLYLMDSIENVYKYYKLTKDLKKFQTLLKINYKYM